MKARKRAQKLSPQAPKKDTSGRVNVLGGPLLTAAKKHHKTRGFCPCHLGALKKATNSQSFVKTPIKPHKKQ
jgi:hypothetical protein